MPVRSGLYDSVRVNNVEDRVYTTDDLARAFQALARSGVVDTPGALAVTETTPATLGVSVALGTAWTRGRWVEVYDAPLTLALPTAPDPTNPRIDLVVARRNLDPNVRDGGIAIRTGAAAVSPAPPAPQQDATIWEEPLAEIRVEPNVASIVNGKITDRRRPSRPPDATLPDPPAPNQLVNGGCEIAQFGAGPFTIAAADPIAAKSTIDRYSIYRNTSGDTITAEQIASTIGSPGKSLRASFTRAAGSAGAAQVSQYLEHFAQLRGQVMSLTVRVKSDTPGAARAHIYDDATETTTSAANVGTGEEVLSVTKTVGASPTRLHVGLTLYATCVVELNDAMLVIGARPSGFRPLTPAEDVLRCLRYRQRLGAAIRDHATAAGQAFDAAIYYKAQMGGTPTFTLSGGFIVNNNGLSIAAASDQYARASITSNAAGECYALDVAVNAEWNPAGG